jgi:REP element-mobilizing transposase RayT
MKPENSLNHSKWECKYHIVWIPMKSKYEHDLTLNVLLRLYILFEELNLLR